MNNDYIRYLRKQVGNAPLMLCGSAVFPIKDRAILLQKRSDNGCWADHGGYLDLGQSFEEAALASIYEEIGIVPNELIFLGNNSGKDSHFIYPNGDEVYIITAGFACKGFSGDVKACTDRLLEVAWFDIDQLPENISPPDKPFVEKIVKMMKEGSL